MLWLETDALIRGKTGGAKSLDDFCRLFYGPPSTAPAVVPYEFNDVIKALNTVLPYDWSSFWTERLNRVRATAPLEGLAAAGWRLAFADAPSPEQTGEAELVKHTDLSYSLGFSMKEEGAIITSVLPGRPADTAGMAPDSSLIAVDGRKYSKHVLADALNASTKEPRTIKLLMEKDEMFKTIDLRYEGGARYPRLERDPSTVDYLAAIDAARSP
jgi:predicted metalloprotease with PDZ domain